MGFWLFDPVKKNDRLIICTVQRVEDFGQFLNPVQSSHAYPFLWAFLFWLCCDEFFDSVHIHQLGSRYIETIFDDLLAIVLFEEQ